MKENIFHAVFEIIDQSRSLTAQYERITAEERQIAADYTRLYEDYMRAIKAGTADRDSIKAAYEAKENKLNQNTHTKQIIKIILPILHDNARATAAIILRPFIANILQKYAGKKPGPKTADKIRDDFHAVTGCNIYFNDTGTRSYISVMTGNYFRYNDLHFTCKSGFTDENNRIIATPAEDIHLSNAPTPCKDPEARAAEIIAAFKAMKEAEAETERRIKEFNAILPAGIDSIHTTGTRNYIVATW